MREVEDARRCLRSSHRDATRTRDADAMASDDARAYDHLVKILLVGDSGVGKSSLLARFISDSFDEQSPTVGVDFKLKHVDVDGTRLKLTVWDTAGQERFRTLTSSYYRGAHGVVFVYDVTSRESFENARETWRKEVEMYGTIANSVKIVIGNKIDREDERTVARRGGRGVREGVWVLVSGVQREDQGARGGGVRRVGQGDFGRAGVVGGRSRRWGETRRVCRSRGRWVLLKNASGTAPSRAKKEMKLAATHVVI